MTVETRLRAAMVDAVAATVPDPDHLVAVARRRGLGIRRRRQAFGTVGVAAALGLAVLAPNLVAGDDPAATDGVPTGFASSTFDPAKTSPITGRSTAAALLYLTLQAAPDGLAGRFAWQDAVGGGTYARFPLFPHQGEDQPGEVAVNVQPGFTGKVARDIDSCAAWMRHCTVDRWADGSVLVTYEDVSSHDSRGYRRVASLLRPDDVRIVVAASNGIDVTERDEQITRTDPPLTMDQLSAIVSQPWWGPELPTYFARTGAQLHGEELTSTAVAGRVS